MKVVDEPSSYGMHHIGSPVETQPLTLRVAPANFSGPPHFSRLVGRCFSEIINEVWQEWEIVNNTFVAMIMKDGDSCGSLYRSARITFVCGNHSTIVNVSEPVTCNYHIVLKTPLVCHPDSMLVYPMLSEDLQQRWDLLEGERLRGYWTDKGYSRKLREILEAAGLLLSRSDHEQLQHEAQKVEQEKIRSGIFASFDQCKESYRELQEKVKRLEEELESAKILSAHHNISSRS
ncbi:N-acetylglucosamine-1-phosphotransferase subunit gamma [Elysia marginata]|uniref:N-acetylglucosamine-1-phosphotransferase subunit gamma n=1 Tax=Elysia marginata TaxID=1093978 RepID=A0AAV4EDI7_9GAST|nr:N-acetylglucosamine-1-phosphotransferase subunit gamma [Elysia marginata]